MAARNPTIIATSIGFQLAGQGALDWRLGPAYGLAASLARAGDSPRVCIVGTALGDAGDMLLAIYAAFGRAGWRASHLALFPQPNVPDIREHLLAQDVIWVAGGSVANLLALWRLHEVGPAMHAAWQAGVVLMGVSAGSVCWFTGGTTDSFGLPLRPVTDGAGLPALLQQPAPRRRGAAAAHDPPADQRRNAARRVRERQRNRAHLRRNAAHRLRDRNRGGQHVAAEPPPGRERQRGPAAHSAAARLIGVLEREQVARQLGRVRQRDQVTAGQHVRLDAEPVAR